MSKNLLKEIRESLMMSKAELARKARISPITITRIEQGMPCRMETKRKIILALGYKISDRKKVFGDWEDIRLLSPWVRHSPANWKIINNQSWNNNGRVVWLCRCYFIICWNSSVRSLNKKSAGGWAACVTDLLLISARDGWPLCQTIYSGLAFFSPLPHTFERCCKACHRVGPCNTAFSGFF